MQVKLTQEELARIINKTQTDLTEVESGEHPENGSTKENEPDSETEGGDANTAMDATAENDDDFEKRYNMDAYDDDEDDNTAGLGIGNLMAHANQREDKYLINPDADDDKSDIEDNIIKPDDNLLLVGHVEGNASILEVYGKRRLYLHLRLLSGVQNCTIPSHPKLELEK